MQYLVSPIAILGVSFLKFAERADPASTALVSNPFTTLSKYFRLNFIGNTPHNRLSRNESHCCECRKNIYDSAYCHLRVISLKFCA